MEAIDNMAFGWWVSDFLRLRLGLRGLVVVLFAKSRPKLRAESWVPLEGPHVSIRAVIRGLS